MHGQGSIELCDTRGQNRRRVFVQFHAILSAIALNQDYLYWTRWNDSLVMQMFKQDGASQRTLYAHDGLINDVRIVGPTKHLGWNKCASNNGGCKYLCLVRPGSSLNTTDIECSCPTHYSMRNGICYPPDNFLLYSQRNTIYRLTTNINDCPNAPLSISGNSSGLLRVNCIF